MPSLVEEEDPPRDYRIITIEGEYGSGGGEIACELSRQLGWKLWDHALTEEIAKVANVECSTVERCEEHVGGAFQRLVKVFWRGSHERSIPLPGAEPFDTDRFVAVGQQAMPDVDTSKWVQPSSVASLIVWLASEAGKDVNGAVIPVYGSGL